MVSAASLVLTSPAKINLFLHVTGQRGDGYHYLETAFQFLEFCDTIKFEWLESDEIVRLDHHEFDLPEIDLIVRAAMLLRDQCESKQTMGAKITLSKVIPPGSGMGGGSSNAATTLIALNNLWQMGLTQDQLHALAVQLGADVPVFIRGKSCWATGIGEIFENFEPPESWYCFSMPSTAVSTAAVFSNPNLTRNHPRISRSDFYQGNFSNDLQRVTQKIHSEVDEAISCMNQYGKAQMNGSGSSIFLRCRSREHADDICQKLPADMNGIVTRSVNDVTRVRSELI